MCSLRPTSAGFDVGDVALIDSLSVEVYKLCVRMIIRAQKYDRMWKLCSCTGAEVSEGPV